MASAGLTSETPAAGEPSGPLQWPPRVASRPESSGQDWPVDGLKCTSQRR